ncbi:unnamed protein product [Auanema sp. JU1783]|nr:unnamed protein product [Auanema sp. JU1783]
MSVVKSEYDICYRMQEEQRVDDSNRTSGCLVSFDKSLCWVGAELEEIAQRVCPFTYCSSVPSCDLVAQQHMVTRRCASTGEWENTNYSECLTVVKEYQHCIQGYCRLCPDALRDLVITVSLTLSVLSVVVLVAAIVLFSIFKSLQCRRLSIHKNLASAFVFRFSVLAAWTIAQTTNAFQDCTKFHPQPLWNLGWICKGILWCVIYFQVASVMWMLIEGAYLYSRFTVFAMRHNEAPWSLFMLCGWGVPFVIVMAWTLVHEHKQEPNSFCWLPYAQGNHLWILAGSIGLALIMNLIFLLGIVTILVKKLRDERTAESKKIW